MAFTNSLNEDVPPNKGERPALGASRIRQLAGAVIERLHIDHYFPADDPSAGLCDNVDTGEHQQTTLRERADPGSVDENKFVVYSKEVNNLAEDDLKAGLIVMDEDEKIKQMTLRDTTSLCLNLEGKDFTACEANIVDALTIEVSGGKLQLKAGDADNGIQAGHLKTTAKAFCDDETLEIDGTNGLQIKTGALGQSDSQSGTTNIEKANNTWSQMGTMAIDMTTTGGAVLATFTATLRIVDTQTQVYVRLTVDGTTLQGTMWTGAGTGLDEGTQDLYEGARNVCVTLNGLAKALAAGELHEFRVEWKREGTGTVLQQGGSYKRVLTVVELPHAVSA